MQASLRISSKDLNPDTVSELLNSPPTESHREGDMWTGNSGVQYEAGTGLWKLDADHHQTLETQIEGLNKILCNAPENWLSELGSPKCILLIEVEDEESLLSLSSLDLKQLGAAGASLEIELPH